MSSETQPLGKVIEVFNPAKGDTNFKKLKVKLVEVSRLINIQKVRRKYRLFGNGEIAGVVDTGIYKLHEDFDNRVIAEYDVSDLRGPVKYIAPDEDGHGTHVAGIIAANGRNNLGIAPHSKLVCLRALKNGNSGRLSDVNEALDEVIKHNEKYGAAKISVVNVSLGDQGNYTSDREHTFMLLFRNILRLYGMNIPVVISAGNMFYSFKSQPGLSYPAICRYAIAVGAVFDADFRRTIEHPTGARIQNPRKGEIAPYSQRLLKNGLQDRPQYVFAPGSITISTGLNPGSSTALQGSSQAAAVVTGLILLVQEFYKIKLATSDLPTVDQVARWIIKGGIIIKDKASRHDNVRNTGFTFSRIDALRTIDLVNKELTF